MEPRSQVFQTLRTPCVRLSQAALALQGPKGQTKDVANAIADVRSALRSVSTRSDVLDMKLADYVFFPISQVLRQLEKLNVRTKELAFECILILLQTAWKVNINPALGVQFVILFSFLADEKDGKAKDRPTSEELQVLVLRCLEAVIRSLSTSSEGQNALGLAENVPHVAKAVSVTLDEIFEGSSADVQFTAATALDAFCAGMTDKEALGGSFLPGIMSCLTKTLRPTTSAARSSKLIAKCLQVLSQLLPSVLGDKYTKDLPESDPNSKASQETRLTKSWLIATASQVKMALASIVKLHQHDRHTVREALSKLCLTLMEECRNSLSESMPMLLEALILLSGSDKATESDVKTLITVDSGLRDSLRSSLHTWIVALPRVMLQADESPKHRLIQQVSTAFRLLNEQDVDVSLLDNIMATSLQDTVANAIHSPKSMVQIADGTSNMELQLKGSYPTPNIGFQPVLASKKAQEETVSEISRLLKLLSDHHSSITIMQSLLSSLHSSSRDTRLATFWITLNLVRYAILGENSIGNFLNFSMAPVHQREEVLDQLYGFSVSLLTESTIVETDWRLQALALETIALQAEQQGVEFREELIDTLYPVVHLVGCSNTHLRDHAITCLNVLARACGYSHSGEMIIQNVDYLVNAVTLRLNTFDISPQAPMVIMMMVKLSGPPLLPYLDDLVDSIFAALESFHGYPKLVNLLFMALKAIVEEGGKAPQLSITSAGERDVHKKPACTPTRVDSVIEMLEIRRKKKTDSGEDGNTGLSPFPRTPWKGSEGLKKSEPKVNGLNADEMERNNEDRIASGESGVSESPPPVPKTYSILLNISKLTQHYLTSSSAELRVSLLSLLSTTIPALAKHENSFLPLIHTIWPVLVPRLDDPEAYVVAGALEVIGLMCVHAGNFMKSRIEEIWPVLERTYNKMAGKAVKDITGSTSDPVRDHHSAVILQPSKSEVEKSVADRYYVQTPARVIWSSLVRVLTQITGYVAVSDNLSDKILQMLLPVIESQPEVKQALEDQNPDAVWLALFRSRHQKTTKPSQSTPPPPHKEEFLKSKFAELV